MSDFTIHHHGSIALLEAHSAAARAWLNANVAHEPWQWLAGMLACEPRAVADLLAGAVEAGLTWEVV